MDEVNYIQECIKAAIEKQMAGKEFVIKDGEIQFELIRCKDCEYLHKHTIVKKYRDIWYSCDLLGCTTYLTFFCKGGVRRDGNVNFD